MSSFILVTGASSGIGEGTVLELSKKNQLILSGRDISKLEHIRSRCSNSDAHLIWCCDLDRERAIIFDSLTSFLLEHKISVNAFIHCAGMTKILPLRNFSPQYVDQIFNTNILSAIEILRVLLKKDNKGQLVNIIFLSALWSLRGDVGNSIYAASKGAINSLVYTLSRELAPKVRVNSICPGGVLTPMTRALLENDALRQSIESDYPLGLGTTDDIINMIVFLLSEKSRWITGQNHIVDGGRSTK